VMLCSEEVLPCGMRPLKAMPTCSATGQVASTAPQGLAQRLSACGQTAVRVRLSQGLSIPASCASGRLRIESLRPTVSATAPL